MYSDGHQESFSSRLKSLQDDDNTNLYVSNIPLDVNEVEVSSSIIITRHGGGGVGERVTSLTSRYRSLINSSMIWTSVS